MSLMAWMDSIDIRSNLTTKVFLSLIVMKGHKFKAIARKQKVNFQLIVISISGDPVIQLEMILLRGHPMTFLLSS